MTSDESFSKKERLIKTKDFRRVYASIRSFKKDFVILKISPNASSENRIGFSISARSVKKAYRRNRIKRCLKEAYRKNKAALKKGFDMVLVVRKDPGARATFPESTKVFLALAKEAGILA